MWNCIYYMHIDAMYDITLYYSRSFRAIALWACGFVSILPFWSLALSPQHWCFCHLSFLYLFGYLYTEFGLVEDRFGNTVSSAAASNLQDS